MEKIPALELRVTATTHIFITSWDAWLQKVVEANRSTLPGNAWLETYLHCPLWEASCIDARRLWKQSLGRL
ncbi:MAG: DUF2094 domain-containing protein [Betaproteobacteria bacterium]|nr:DUF2094 domain-containing protein [Betaproteobacteria bacterium]